MTVVTGQVHPLGFVEVEVFCQQMAEANEMLLSISLEQPNLSAVFGPTT